METQDATLVRVAVLIEECVGKQKRRDVLRGDIAGAYRLSDDGGGTAQSGKHRVPEGIFVNQYEGAGGAIALQGEAVSARNEDHGPVRSERRLEKRVPVLRSDLVKFGAHYGIGELRRDEARRVTGRLEGWRCQSRRHIGRGRADQTLSIDEARRTVGIAQVNRHWNDRCANASDRTIIVVTIVIVVVTTVVALASFERRSANHPVLPRELIDPIGIEARVVEVAVESRDGINPKNRTGRNVAEDAAGPVGEAHVGGAGVQAERVAWWELIGLPCTSGRCHQRG